MAHKVTEAQVRKTIADLDAGRMPERQGVSEVVAAFTDVLRKPGLWGDEEDQVAGLRRLAVLETGTQGAIDERRFAERMLSRAVFQALPAAISAVAATEPDKKLQQRLNERADWLVYDAAMPGPAGARVIDVLSEIGGTFDESRWEDLERGTMDSDVQATREFAVQAVRQAKLACTHCVEGRLADMARASAWVSVAAGMAIARKETANQSQAERERRRDHEMDCVAEGAAQSLTSLGAPASEQLRLIEVVPRAGDNLVSAPLRSPWVVQPDAGSHGRQLAVVNTATGAILARTPECSEYGARGQIADMANAELMALAPVLHKTVWEVEKALQQIERFDRRMGQEERVPTGEDYNEVLASAHALLEALMPTVELMRLSAGNVLDFEREFRDSSVELERDGEEDEQDEQVVLGR